MLIAGMGSLGLKMRSRVRHEHFLEKMVGKFSLDILPWARVVKVVV